MNPLRSWIEDEVSKPWDKPSPSCDPHANAMRMGFRHGFVHAMGIVKAELKAREDAERERVDQNVAALDHYAGEVLAEKEGKPQFRDHAEEIDHAMKAGK